MNTTQLFIQRTTDSRYNTSYPLSPADWQSFRTPGELHFAPDAHLSFYLHIPFCQHLCPFCEYQRTTLPPLTVQEHYIQALRHDITHFLDSHPQLTLHGFDIGGGTPTALHDTAFAHLIDLYLHTLGRTAQSAHFEPSIEATFQTLTPEKIRHITRAGIRRLSLGIQSSVHTVQTANGRHNPQLTEMARTLSQAYAGGIEKINLDLMYGLRGQTLPDVQADIDCIRQLRPQQVTLYELRPNCIRHTHHTTKDLLHRMYTTLYSALTALGYSAVYGQNTFTLTPADRGLSSYLRHRMLSFLPYKGFGLAAQSMSPQGISYNLGKDGRQLAALIARSQTYPAADTYTLPPSELLAKYIAVSGYYGRLSVAVASRLLQADFRQHFQSELDFCLTSGYLTLQGDTLAITPKGQEYYGAVWSLFFDPLDPASPGKRKLTPLQHTPLQK